MTPDMKRLCKAVESALPTCDGYDLAPVDPDQHAERIVRAVLMALRGSMYQPANGGEGIILDSCSDRSRGLAAMIDHILAEPAGSPETAGIVDTRGSGGPQIIEGQNGNGQWVDWQPNGERDE